MAEDLSQARYERALLMEISKLQAALAHERSSIAAENAQMQADQSAANEKKVTEAERSSRL